METLWGRKLANLILHYIYSDYTLDIYVYICFSVDYCKHFIETFFILSKGLAFFEYFSFYIFVPVCWGT